MLFELYYRNYAAEGDVDLNEFTHDSEPPEYLHRGAIPSRLESLAERPARKLRDAAMTRKPQKRKDGLSL